MSQGCLWNWMNLTPRWNFKNVNRFVGLLESCYTNSSYIFISQISLFVFPRSIEIRLEQRVTNGLSLLWSTTLSPKIPQNIFVPRILKQVSIEISVAPNWCGVPVVCSCLAMQSCLILFCISY